MNLEQFRAHLAHRNSQTVTIPNRMPKESDFEVIRVPKSCIPIGAQLVEAYITQAEVIVMGDPEEEPEGLTEAELNAWYETAHDCDLMGCGSLGNHVLYRFPKTAPPAAEQEER